MGNDTDNAPPSIDVVIAWVDGNDPNHQKKMEPYIESSESDPLPGAKPTRFRSVNEIRYCVLSVFTFAPFVRNVYIVTDEQDPQLEEDIRRHFPERLQNLKIIDHKEIFRGHEEFLPTFNSRTIESMIWRIEGLSDHFVYFNDDSFLIRKTEISDFFVENRPVLRGNWLPTAWPRTLWVSFQNFYKKVLLGQKRFEPKPSYHLGQWFAARKAGFKYRYFYFNHTPYSICKKTAENLYYNDPGFFKDHLCYRFRKYRQVSFISLLYHLELRNGNRNIRRPDVSYANPVGRKEGYIDRKIELCKRDERIKFLCVQSMDLCNKENQEKVFNWLEDLFRQARTDSSIKTI